MSGGGQESLFFHFPWLRKAKRLTLYMYDIDRRRNGPRASERAGVEREDLASKTAKATWAFRVKPRGGTKASLMHPLRVYISCKIVGAFTLCRFEILDLARRHVAREKKKKRTNENRERRCKLIERTGEKYSKNFPVFGDTRYVICEPYLEIIDFPEHGITNFRRCASRRDNFANTPPSLRAYV